MAENTTQAQHITELDFDVSGIPSQLKSIETTVEKFSINVREMLNNNLKVNLSANISSDLSQIKTAINNSAGDITPKITLDMASISSQISNVSSITNAQARQVATTILKEQEKTSGALEREVNKTSQKTIQANTEIQKKKALAEIEFVSLQEKNIEKLRTEQIASDNKVAERRAKNDSDIYKNQLAFDQKRILSEEKANQQIYLEEQKHLAKMEEIQARNATKNTSTGSLDTFVGRSVAFLEFEALQLAQQAVRNTVTELKEVEFQVMEITRVLGDATLDVKGYTDSMFDLSIGYGRNFDDVAEVTLRFAQAGFDAVESIKLTESTLLALNTAELNVEQSTNSLIGVMKQWGTENADFMSELPSLIDKINYTADNYAITSQDLVDGLLRSSSAANNAKLSIEQTIGALVALRESSGRSGKEVGTAFNSLIAYTQRANSLNVFESLGVQVYADEARTSLMPILDLWKQLAVLMDENGDMVFDTLSKYTDMESLMNEEVANATGTLEEYNIALETQNELNNTNLNDLERRALLEQAGTHRRNYFTALLTNFNSIQKVSNDLQYAEGHSMRENAKYMDTLTAKYESMIAALTQLGVSAGESGFTDLAKMVMEAVTSIARLLEVGDLTAPVLAGITASIVYSFTTAKTAIIAETAAVQAAVGATATLTLQQKLAAISTNLFSKATIGATASVAAATAGISLLVLGVIKTISAVKEEIEYINSANNAHKERIELLDEEKKSQTTNVSTAEYYIKKLEEMTDANGELTGSYTEVQSLVTLLNESIPELNLQYNEQTNKLSQNNEQLKERISLMRQEIEMEYQRDKYSSLVTKQMDLQAMLLEQQKEYNDYMASGGSTQLGITPDGFQMVDAEGQRLQSNIAQTEIKIREATTAVEEFEQSMGGFGETSGETSTELEKINEEIEQSVISLDDLKNAYTVLKNAVDEYNSGQGITFDTLQALSELDAKYLPLLITEGNQLALNETAFKNLAQAQADELRVAILRKQIDMISSFQNEQEALDSLTGKLLTATSASYMLNTALAEAFSGKGWSRQGQQQIVDYMNNLNETLKKQIDVSSLYNNTTETNNNSGYSNDAITERTDALKAQQEQIKENAQAEIDALTRVQEANTRATQERDLITSIESAKDRSGVDARKAEYEARQSLSDKQAEWSIADQISQIESTRDAQVASIQEQIDAMESGYQQATASNIATTQAGSNEMYNNMVDSFVLPLANGFVDAMQQAFEMIDETTVSSAYKMMTTYNDNFFVPFALQVQEMQALSGIRIPNFNVFNPFGSGTTGNVSTNNSRNVTVSNTNYISNATDANSLLKMVNNQITENIMNMP